MRRLAGNRVQAVITAVVQGGITLDIREAYIRDYPDSVFLTLFVILSSTPTMICCEKTLQYRSLKYAILFSRSYLCNEGSHIYRHGQRVHVGMVISRGKISGPLLRVRGDPECDASHGMQASRRREGEELGRMVQRSFPFCTQQVGLGYLSDHVQRHGAQGLDNQLGDALPCLSLHSTEQSTSNELKKKAMYLCTWQDKNLPSWLVP